MSEAIEKLREAVEPYIAERGTEEAKEAIYADSTHTSVLWDDGEITYRKNGDLWGARSWHQWSVPFLGSGELWSLTEDGHHQYRVVTDSDGLKEAIEEWADEYTATRVVTFELQFTHERMADDDTALKRTEERLENMSKDQIIDNLIRTAEVEELDN